MKKNLILGLVSKTLRFWEDIAPFATSYRDAKFENCECILFTDKMSSKTIKKIKSCGINVLQTPKRFIKDGRIGYYRWKVYQDYIKDKIDDYGMIFFSGVRDVFFQRDIFKFYDSSKPFIGIGLENGTFSSETINNKKWFTERYGVTELEKVKDCRIACADTIWGTSREVFTFIERLIEELYSDKYPYSFGSDQVTENWLIYHENFCNDIVIPSGNEDGPVVTIGFSKKNIQLDSHDNILNGKGEIAAVIHQYDRYPYIVEKVVNKFCPEIKGLYYKSMILDYPMYTSTPQLRYKLARFYYRSRKQGFMDTLRTRIKRFLARNNS